MNKIGVSFFGFIFLIVSAVVWAGPVPDTGQDASEVINSMFYTTSSATHILLDEMAEQESAPTGCAATIDGTLTLHIPYLSFATPIFGTISLWAEFVYQFNPALVLFKLKNAGFTIIPFLCTPATLSSDFKIYIPDLMVPNVSTNFWLSLEFSPLYSTDGNVYFRITGFGALPN